MPELIGREAKAVTKMFMKSGLRPNMLQLASIQILTMPRRRIRSSIPLGLGTFEAACVGMLSLLGVAMETALAATLLLRGLTFWLPMVPGLWLAKREIAPG
jgi:hypothetical protein